MSNKIKIIIVLVVIIVFLALIYFLKSIVENKNSNNGPNEIYDTNESNNSSLIVSIKYGGFSYLFMGDSQNSRIKDYLSNHNEQYDFIKIPYHGNYQKRLNELLSVTKPKYAVITCSDSEPDITETVELLEKLKIKYYLTKDGEINVKSNDNITFMQ